MSFVILDNLPAYNLVDKSDSVAPNQTLNWLHLVVQVHPDGNANARKTVHPLRLKDAGGVTQSEVNHEQTRETAIAATKTNLEAKNGVAIPDQKTNVSDAQVHPCLRTPTARKVFKVIKFGYPIMSTIASLLLLGLILHGVSRPVCVDKVGAILVILSAQSHMKSVGRNESRILEPGNHLEPLLRNECFTTTRMRHPLASIFFSDDLPPQGLGRLSGSHLPAAAAAE